MKITLVEVIKALKEASYHPFSNPSKMLTHLQQNSSVKSLVPSSFWMEGIYPFTTFLPFTGTLHIAADSKAEAIMNSFAHAEAFFTTPENQRNPEDLEGVWYDSDKGYYNVPAEIKKKAVSNAFSSFQKTKETLEKDADFLNPYANTLDSWQLKHLMYLRKLLSSYRKDYDNPNYEESRQGISRVIDEVELAINSLEQIDVQDLPQLRADIFTESLVALISDDTFQWELDEKQTAETLTFLKSLHERELEPLLTAYHESVSARLAAIHNAQIEINKLTQDCAKWNTTRDIVVALTAIDPRLARLRVSTSGSLAMFGSQIFEELGLS